MAIDLKNDELGFILNSPMSEDSKIHQVEKLFVSHNVELILRGAWQYQVINGCIPAIMLYPSKHKIMFQENGKNYVCIANFATLIAMIKGDVAFKKIGE